VRVGGALVGDFEEVERLQAGIRDWLLRTTRSGRHELRDVPAQAVLPLLCAAAFGPALGDASDLTSAGAVARIGVLSSVGAHVLAGVLGGAAERAREDPQRETGQSLQREISRSIDEILAAADERADGLRSDIAMVMRDIDAGGTVFRAAIETGNEQVQREVLVAVEAVSIEFGEMAFMLADLAQAAGDVQDSLGGQGIELRAASEQVGRQSADVRMIREKLAAIERRSGQWVPASGGEENPNPDWAGACPYRGLRPYDQAHAAVFFGRERLTAELVGKLAATGIVMVSGGSGAGKTSLLQAGLVPALARGVQLPGSSSWPRISLTPTARPLTALAAKLATLGGGDPAAIRQRLADAPGEAHLLIGQILPAAADQPQWPTRDGPGPAAARLVLIIDQFEQVFAAGGEEGRLERTAFIDAVCTAATKPAGPRGEPPVRVVIAVGGDYWDQCSAYPQLVPAMEQDQLVVGPMPEAGLLRAITGPAEVSGLRIESALIETVLADARTASGEQGAWVLPQLSQAMMATWVNRDSERLTAEGYDRAGRVARAVEVSAEAVYNGLADNQKTIARDTFRQLTAVGHDRRPLRRTASRADLRAGHPKSQWSAVDAVLEAFAGRHLMVVQDGTAEIAHDVLLQAWPRLRDWLAEDQSSLILHGQLAEDTIRWRANGKDSSVLYRGFQLVAAGQAVRVWQADPGRYPALIPPEAAFLRASRRAATRGRWLRRTLAAAVVVLLVAALAGAGLAVRSARNTAGQQRTADLSGRLAAQSTALDALNPVTAALLAGAAWRVAPTAQARYSLLESLAQPVRGILAAQSGVVTALAYGPGGTTLAAGYADGTIRLWDVASHRLVSSTTWGAAVLTLTFSPDGKALEVTGPGAVGRWNLITQAKIAAQPLTGGAAGDAPGDAAAFSPDGKLLATGDEDGNVQLWNVATRQEIGEPMSSDLKPVDAVAFSPDGTTLAAASSDGTVQLWDVATQQEAGSAIAASTTPVKTLMFSPGGKLLATGDEDGNVRLWDVATQNQAGPAMATGNPVAALAFNATGTTLATAGNGGSTELWDVATQRQTGAPLAAQSSGGVSAVAFSPGPGGLATGNGDGTVQLWNAAGFHQASAPLATSTPESATAAAGHAPAVLSANGEIVAVSGAHGAVRLWNAVTGRPIGGPIAGGRAVTGLAVSPDGKTVAVVADGLQLWATATGQRIGNPLPPSDAGGPVAFSPDDALVATVGSDGKARLWDAATAQETGDPMTASGPAADPQAVAFSPNGKILATVAANGDASLWSVATQRQIGTPMTAGPGTTAGTAPTAGPAAGPATAAAAFSQDGTMLATASGNGTARLWDVTTRQEIGAPMTADTQPLYAVAFNPSGTMLATASGDGTARLWDVATQQEIGAPMTADTQPLYAVAFNPSGTMLATAGGDGTARLWDVTFPASLLAATCDIADQSLTRQQWADYAGSQPFQQVCPRELARRRPHRLEQQPAGTKMARLVTGWGSGRR
jgi:WD40 repeat protein